MTPRHFAGIAAALMLVAGCGLRPMYGGHRNSGAAALEKVEVATIEGRLGQRLRNQLLDRFYLEGRPAQPEYRLVVTLNASDTLLDSQFESARLNNAVSVVASYRLIDANGAVLGADALNTTQYRNAVPGQYALFATQQDAYERAIDLIAGDLVRRVSLLLERKAQ